MRLFRLLTCVLCFVAMFGCGQTFKNIPAITGAGSSAYVGYDEVIDIISAHLDIYSDQEIEALRRANKHLVVARLELERLVAGETSLANLAMRLPDLMPLYDSMKHSYLVAYKVIISKIDTYDSWERVILLEYNETCLRLDRAITEAMRDAGGFGNEQIVRDILNFMGLVMKIVIPLLIL